MWIYRTLGAEGEDDESYAVGFMEGDRFRSVEQFLYRESARRAVHYLNGGTYDGAA